MARVKSGIELARRHVIWLAVAAVPLIVAACNNGGGSGY